MRFTSFLFIGFILCASCTDRSYDVQYTVECQQCAVSYLDEEIQFVPRDTVTGSWEYSFTGESGQIVKVAAQNLVNDSTAAVSVSILVDGTTEKTSTRTGILIAVSDSLILE